MVTRQSVAHDVRSIEAIYAVTSGEMNWTQVGATLRARFDSHIGNMFLMPRHGPAPEMLDTSGMPTKAMADYAVQFHVDDPWLVASRALIGLNPNAMERVWLGSEMLPDAELAESRFYRDFGRSLGTHHGLFVAPQVGRAGRVHLSMLRSQWAPDFTDQDRRDFARLVPHIRRSLQLGGLLAEAGARLTRARATLDALTLPIIVVDAMMTATDVNRPAEVLIASEAGLEFVRLGPKSSADVRLSIRHKRTADIVLAFVQEVTAGVGSGGTARIPRGTGRKPLAILVMPLPLWLPRTASTPEQGTVKGSAMLLSRDLDRSEALSLSYVASIFSLTTAEAEVAIELCAGLTAEVVAARRGTSVTTVRSQVRAVLEKTAFKSLRELTHALAQFG